MDLLSHREESVCDWCHQKFKTHEELISHVRHVHNHPIVKCDECGKEFVHEKDRLHHVREEHKQKIESREHKNLHQHKTNNTPTPQEEVDAHTKNFSDNF